MPGANKNHETERLFMAKKNVKSGYWLKQGRKVIYFRELRSILR